MDDSAYMKRFVGSPQFRRKIPSENSNRKVVQRSSKSKIFKIVDKKSRNVTGYVINGIVHAAKGSSNSKTKSKTQTHEK